jgi:putative membrane protein
VYGDGSEEPDYRFGLANERTFLAWIRTSLGLLVAGLAVDLVDLPARGPRGHVLAITLIALALVGATCAWVRWALTEHAMRRRRALPSFGFLGLAITAVLVAGIAVTITSR